MASDARVVRQQFVLPTSLSLFFISLFSVWLLSNVGRSALAHSESILLEMPVYGSVQRHQLVSQAESLVLDKISQAFQADSKISELNIAVLGDQNGSLIPILTTTISRQNWNQSSDIRRWTKYENSYSLFQSPNIRGRTVVATRPQRVTRQPQSQPREILTQLDQAFSERKLSPKAIQRNLSHWD